MHRIDTPTAQKDKFGVGKNGFTRGNPQTGTPATDLDNDYFDMLQEELAGVVEATGVNLDKSKHNQLLTALKALNVGRLINVQTFTSSGVYTPTPGTKSIIVKAIGGGGAGGGAIATSTGVSAGSGGSSGSYAEARYTTGFDSVPVTIGLGGTSVVGGKGGDGGTTSFGALLSCPGGGGGPVGSASNTTISYTSQGSPGGAPTGSGLIVATKGQPGQNGVSVGTTGIGIGGIGSQSQFGGGGPQNVNNNNAAAAQSFGAGGGATCNAPSQSAHSGGDGAPGVVIIEEYA